MIPTEICCIKYLPAIVAKRDLGMETGSTRLTGRGNAALSHLLPVVPWKWLQNPCDLSPNCPGPDSLTRTPGPGPVQSVSNLRPWVSREVISPLAQPTEGFKASGSATASALDGTPPRLKGYFAWDTGCKAVSDASHALKAPSRFPTHEMP